jgi:hypothetical protein
VKPRTKRILLVVGGLLGALIVLRLAAALVWPTINDVSTDGTPGYPDLRSQRFKVPAQMVYSASHAVAKDMGLEITGQSMREIRAVATTPVFRFKDDVTITFSNFRGGATIVSVRSRSRVGTGDFGTNARRIREFQRRLEEKMRDPAFSKK